MGEKMSKYACRAENYSLKTPPSGMTRELHFCTQCPSGPFKSAKCLHGKTYEARQLIQEIVAGRIHDTQIAAHLGKYECQLCGYPLAEMGTEMHRECRNKVIGRIRGATSRGWRLTPQAAIQQLLEEGDDAPPF